MPFFQNVFTTEFIGSLVLGDRHHSPSFRCQPNTGRGANMVVTWGDPNFNLSGTDSAGNSKGTLRLHYAIDFSFQNWTMIAVNVTAGAASAAAVTPFELVDALNADVTFAERFTASIEAVKTGSTPRRVIITQKLGVERMRFYVENGRAEEVLKFNARAGVNELPTFFSRHTIANRYEYDDGVALLIELDESNAVDAAVINNAVDHKGATLGYSSAVVHEDYELLRGKSGLFMFKKITVDGSNRITQIIEYPAGAIEGDFAKKTEYTYTSSNTNPDQTTEIPYTLTGSDLVTP